MNDRTSHFYAMAQNKPTCHPCRSRKVRCDGKQPVCSRCDDADRECSYRVKPRQFSFRYSSLSSLGATAATLEQMPALETEDHETNAVACQNEPSPQYSHTSADLTPLPSVPSYSSETVAPALGLPISSPADSHSALPSGLEISVASTSYRRHEGTYAEKLTPLEGELLQFYVENIGPWLDVTSPERHYTYTVPRLALRWPLLLHATMTCSAHILRLLTKLERPDLGQAEAHYQNKCLEILIPLLDDLNAAFSDEIVLATIAILRMSEQYDEFHIDRQFHLVPQAFDHFRGIGMSSTTLGGLKEATFYSYVRADIRMSILGKRSTRIELDKWPLNTTLISDADWANRMTYLFVQCINLCFGGGGPGIMDKDELVRQVDEWKAMLPRSFEPYYYQTESEDEPFPIVLLLCPWHAVGHQFYHAAKILLTTTFFGEHQDSFNALAFNKHISFEILPHARTLCGISFSNKHYGCRINASHLLALGAQFFTGKLEQWRVLHYFEMLQEESAWPSKACREMLEEAYGHALW